MYKRQEQATSLPTWFPILGKDRFELKAEVETAKSVTPGQGQAVMLAGVKIGDITGVELEDGVAVITMDVEHPDAELIHTDASALLRPRTGLQDMTLEIDPGTEGEPMAEGATIGLASTKPSINLDQILASLDGDTQAYLQLLLAGGAESLDDGRDRELSALLRRFEPTTRDIARINGAVAKRRNNLRRVVTNFKLIAERLAKSDVKLAEFVDSQNAVFGAFADQEQNLRATLRGLPGALQATDTALKAGERLSVDLKPALTELIPAATALEPALKSLQPFFVKTLDPIKDQIRPFARQTQGVVKDLRDASQPLDKSSRQLDGSFTELTTVLNGLAYNPPGADEGYLFYLSWLNHNVNSTLLTEDSAGPLARSLILYSCNTSRLADNALLTRPALDTTRTLTRLPTTEEIC